MTKATEQILLETVINTQVKIGELIAEISGLKKDVNNGLTSNVKEIKSEVIELKEHVNKHILTRKDTCPVIREIEEKTERKNVKIKRKTDLKLLRISLVISGSAILVSGGISLVVAFFT